MHASSLENMFKCYQRYICPSILHNREDVVVLDVGGANVNGGYREVFPTPRYRYQAADINAGSGVDIVLKDPYQLPFEDSSVDIVLSGQMLEHCEFFWLSFAEMIRVLKPDGYLFLIAPSAGPVHQYPVDCYRFYPDAYRALAKYTNCHLTEVWLDDRGPWRDLVGVFSKQPKLSIPQTTNENQISSLSTPQIQWDLGSAEEEATSGSVHYLEVLANLQNTLSPSLYIEIGVRHGRSLELAKGKAVGIDPAPDIKVAPLPASTQLFITTSDNYFDNFNQHPLSEPPDLVFIDGMHLFEYALRDFMHIEKLSKPETLIVIDDIFPSHPSQAKRKRQTRVWTGDIWKLQHCLSMVRPDLILLPLDTKPTGLLLVAGLDSSNRTLWDQYNTLVRKYAVEADLPAVVLSRKNAISPTHRVVSEMLEVLKQSSGSTSAQIKAKLKTVHCTVAPR
jgi:SAM-dependent methyltransferase